MKDLFDESDIEFHPNATLVNKVLKCNRQKQEVCDLKSYKHENTCCTLKHLLKKCFCNVDNMLVVLRHP